MYFLFLSSLVPYSNFVKIITYTYASQISQINKYSFVFFATNSTILCLHFFNGQFIKLLYKLKLLKIYKTNTSLYFIKSIESFHAFIFLILKILGTHSNFSQYFFIYLYYLKFENSHSVVFPSASYVFIF